MLTVSTTTVCMIAPWSYTDNPCYNKVIKLLLHLFRSD